MFNRLKITTKLYGGFATILALLAVMSVLAVTGFWSVQSLFGDYRQTARTSLILAELEEKLIVARISALKYRANGEASTADEVRMNVKSITDELKALPELMTDQTKITAIQEKSQKMVDYLAAFEETVKLRGVRNTHVAQLSELGPAARTKMSDVMESAYRDDDAQAAYYAGRVNEALMLGRFYTERYLLNNTTEARDRALKELQEAITRSDSLLKSLQNPTRRSLANESIKLTTEYVNNVNAISDVIAERNGYRQTMDEIGPEVMKSYKTLLAEQIDQQNELGPTAEAQIGATTTQVMILAIICVVLGSFAAIFLGRMISTGIARVNADMGELANGNKNFEVFGTDRGDEIGDMARALDVFRLNALEVERLEAERKAEEENGAQAQRKAAMLKMADDFENRVGTIVDEVSRVAGALSTSAEMLGETAGQSRERSGSVAAASEEASANVQTVASAAEELTAAIGEVSETIGRAAEMARRSADMAGESQGELDRLNGAIADVDTVIGSINDVAEQTNLLALNATIEAARAGEMGKGFAVVAQEVKALANQTKTMTDEIASKLNAVRESAQAAIKATVAIISEVREIDTTTASIAATMEEQSSATLEISRSTQDAAEGAIEVSRSIQGVSEAVDRSEVETQSVRQASGELTTTASELKVQVDGFVTEIRAA